MLNDITLFTLDISNKGSKPNKSPSSVKKKNQPLKSQSKVAHYRYFEVLVPDSPSYGIVLSNQLDDIQLQSLLPGIDISQINELEYE